MNNRTADAKAAEQFDYFYAINEAKLHFEMMGEKGGLIEFYDPKHRHHFTLSLNWIFSDGSGNLLILQSSLGMDNGKAVFFEGTADELTFSLNNCIISLEIYLDKLITENPDKGQWASLNGTYDKSIDEDHQDLITSYIEQYLLTRPDGFLNALVNVNTHFKAITAMKPSSRCYGVIQGEETINSYFYLGLMFDGREAPSDIFIDAKETGYDFFYKISEDFFLESCLLSSLNEGYTYAEDAIFDDNQSERFAHPYYFPRLFEDDEIAEAFIYSADDKKIYSKKDSIRIPEAKLADNLGVSYDQILESKTNLLTISFKENRLHVSSELTIVFDKKCNFSLFGIEIPEGDEYYTIKMTTSNEYLLKITTRQGEDILFFEEDLSAQVDKRTINSKKSPEKEFFDHFTHILDKIISGLVSMVLPIVIDVMAGFNPFVAAAVFAFCGELAKLFTEYEQDKKQAEYFKTLASINAITTNFQNLLPVNVGNLNVKQYYVNSGIVIAGQLD